MLCRILEAQVKQLRRKHDFIIVAVAGSVGKTSTKLAIAKVVGDQKRVRHQEGNYNDRLTVPLVIFGHKNPYLFNIFAWLKIVASNYQQIWGSFEYEVVVVELGTDAPGQLADFEYLRPDISVITAVTPEHMEFFKTINAVAKEELSVCDFSDKSIINRDDIDPEYIKGYEGLSYGLHGDPTYSLRRIGRLSGEGQQLQFGSDMVRSQLLGEQGAKVVLAAYAVGLELGLDRSKIMDTISKLEAFAGRMRVMKGINGSLIIDDTYNASPAAVIAGLQVLYDFDTPQRIAILGNMNELGATSKDLHQEVGNFCEKTKLDLVVTIGPDANKYMAESARKAGCNVESFDSPYDAGEYVSGLVKSGAVIFAKGSQNRVFAEEALKSLLLDASDQKKLVRQSDYWMKIKRSQFKKG